MKYFFSVFSSSPGQRADGTGKAKPQDPAKTASRKVWRFLFLGKKKDDHATRQLSRDGSCGQDLAYRRRAHREHRPAAAAGAPDPFLPDPGHAGREPDQRDAPQRAPDPARPRRPAAGGDGAVLDPRSSRGAGICRKTAEGKKASRRRARASDARVVREAAHHSGLERPDKLS